MEEIRKELEELELGQVTGGTGSGSGYEYVKMYIVGDILKVYAGYDVLNINVYRNGSKIRYTRAMASGETLDIQLFGEAPMEFLVTGHALRDDADFEYSL